MLQNRKIKICLVGDSLSGGGAERVHAFLSDFFSGKGIDIHNIVVLDSVSYQYSGQLLNLGKLKNSSNGIYNKFIRLRVLRSYIKKNKFTYIIDFRMRKKPFQDWLIAKFIFTVPTVYTVHSSFIEGYMPSRPWITRLIYANSYGIAAIAEKIRVLIENKHRLPNVTTIYNPVNTGFINKKISAAKAHFDFKYIAAAGSMSTGIKQFDGLIKAYCKSDLPADNVKLVILGEGSQKDTLISLADSMGLADKIIFTGFQDNPYIYLRDALFFVLSSKFEGMPMVLLESLACSTPVVSFDCVSGPSEIITNGSNGLLIKDQDFDRLTDGINTMYSDKELYNRCRENAQASIEKFSLENIGREWMEYLKIDKLCYGDRNNTNSED